ncbi:Eaa1 [Klebsiella pneumoniae]|uniref:DUF551 domain-containing protein n=1 Tax=Klebsiella pneumoniae TaxID=573 RepID=UPI000808A413|nr:DUF551 domain-containing protein [Klebsiella pneumoniae]SBX82812.1 Eaa1 [Klebsiella pneumoniae]
MTNNQLAENSVNQLLNSVRLARDNAERADNRVDHSFYYALTIALEELQERRKAAMDSEPVAYIDKQWTLVYYVPPMSMGLKIGDKLYRHAQPVPVVPNEIKHRIGGLDWGWEGEFNRGWNACRAAMLAAAPQSPGSEPATVPGKWIPVSERMPEMGEKQRYVLAADFKNNYWPNIPNTQVGVYGDWFDDGNPTWDDGDGEDLHLKEVTHWMSLPAGPKEVQGE